MSDLRDRLLERLTNARCDCERDPVTCRAQWPTDPRHWCNGCVMRAAAALPAAGPAPSGQQLAGDGPPVASCLLCGVARPLAVWYCGTRAGVCEPCRSRAAEGPAPAPEPPAESPSLIEQLSDPDRYNRTFDPAALAAPVENGAQPSKQVNNKAAVSKAPDCIRCAAWCANNCIGMTSDRCDCSCHRSPDRTAEEDR